MSKEDIEIEAALYEDACHTPSIQQHFIDGANWAKHETVDKACDWLMEHVLDYVSFDHLNGIDIEYDELTSNLKKAMEDK